MMGVNWNDIFVFASLGIGFWFLILILMQAIGEFFQSKPVDPPPLLDKAWRRIDWNARDKMKEKLRKLEISNSESGVMHLLVEGPVGAGKSSFINSIDSIFQNRMTCGAITDANSGGSFTKMYQDHNIKDGEYGSYLPFRISDSMGLEKGVNKGMHHHDLTKALKGLLKDGHMLNTDEPCSEKDEGYNSSPTIGDQIHCLVAVIPATSVKRIEGDIFEKMKDVRAKATQWKIPQVALLTKVDEVCEEVKKDIKLVYRSRKIKEQMQTCSNYTGITMNQIFPVKNYHEEIELDDDTDVLLLSALTHILNYANDHVAEIPPTED